MLEIGMPFFHATQAYRIEEIKSSGLGSNLSIQNFVGCVPGVYLSEDPVYCLSFMLEHVLHTADDDAKPSDELEKFVFILIDDSRIDQRLLSHDPNVLHLNPVPPVFLYRGIIDITNMPILSFQQIFDFIKSSPDLQLRESP